MSRDTHSTWKRLGQKTVYKGRVHIIEYNAVLPNGEPTTYEVDHGETDAVAVLIKTADNKIVLTRQFRFPLDDWIYDLPGGAQHVGETTQQAAIRECREEVGLAPKKLEKIANFYPNPARSDWSIHVFYCEEYESSKLHLNDPAENVETVLMPAKELKKLVDEQKIVDPTLLIAWHTAYSKSYIKP